jgi:hypothetical protein
MNFSVPLISFVFAAALQWVIPSLLQTKLSVAAYSAYVVVFSAAGIIGMADGGLALPVLRELTALHGRTAFSQYVGELIRSNRIYLLAAAVGLVAGVVALLSAQPSLAAAWPPARHAPFILSAGAYLLAIAFRFWSSTIYFVMLSSTGNYIFGQVVGIVNLVVPAVLLCIALVVWRDLTVALWISASSIAIQGLVEAFAAWRLFRRDFAGVPPSRPPRSLGELVSDGLTIRIGEQLVVNGFPYALTLLAVALVPVAVPARTISNSCRLISQQFVSLLGVRITRLIAQSGADPSAANHEYHMSAAALGSFHLLMVGLVDLAARPIFELWLPGVASTVHPYLPSLMADQVLLSAALPSSVMFLAHGHLRAWGISKLVGALFGLLVLVMAIHAAPQAAFGLAHLAATVPTFAICAWAEVRGRWDFPIAGGEPQLRYGRALVLAVAYVGYSEKAWWVSAITIGTSLPSLMNAAWAYWRLFGQSKRAVAT